MNEATPGRLKFFMEEALHIANKKLTKDGDVWPPSPRKDHDISFYIKKQSLRSQFNTIV
jgi:hypothetical protein